MKHGKIDNDGVLTVLNNAVYHIVFTALSSNYKIIDINASTNSKSTHCLEYSSSQDSDYEPQPSDKEDTDLKTESVDNLEKESVEDLEILLESPVDDADLENMMEGCPTDVQTFNNALKYFVCHMERQWDKFGRPTSSLVPLSDLKNCAASKQKYNQKLTKASNMFHKCSHIIDKTLDQDLFDLDRTVIYPMFDPR